MTDHSSATTDVTFRHGTSRSCCQGLHNMFRLDVQAIDIIQTAIIRLSHDWKRPELVVWLVMGDSINHQGIAHHAYTMRIGQSNWGGQCTRLSEPFQPGHFAVTVEPMAASEERILPDVALVWLDDCDA